MEATTTVPGAELAQSATDRTAKLAERMLAAESVLVDAMTLIEVICAEAWNLPPIDPDDGQNYLCPATRLISLTSLVQERVRLAYDRLCAQE